MDAFKGAEIDRMREGGNKTWKDFFDKAEANEMAGITWDDATIKERYEGGVGEEYKERLSAKVEGREYVAVPKVPATKMEFNQNSSRSATPLSSSRNDSPSRPGVKAKVDDKYFAGLGAANANRSADLPPSQGGKYAGFGSAGPELQRQEAGLPGLNDLQRDPVAALSKGFGWFTKSVATTAKTVNDGYIQPTAAKVCWSILLPILCCHLLGLFILLTISTS
jgi:ADP-ribosylation factor GTPase-activating protein 1